jgi:hypothetical protein
MRVRPLLVGVIALLLVGNASCASNPSSSNLAPKALRITPPKMMRGDPIRMRTPESFSAKIEVRIDADGEPDMQTLKISGMVGGNARQAITEWIEHSSFEPAKQGGSNIPGIFMMQMKISVSRGR